VIPLFLSKKKTGRIPITDSRMTRFWLTLDQAVQLVLNLLREMRGGEVFVPKVPAMNIMSLVEAVAPDCEHEIIGIRPGEKLHETLITEDEGERTYDAGNFYVITPAFDFQRHDDYKNYKKLPQSFRYSSDDILNQMSVQELRALLDEKSKSIAAELV